jgi:hypothetical protein
VCDNGYLRPIGKVATDDNSNVKEYRCDSSDCETNRTIVGFCDGIKLLDFLSAEVIRAEDQ